MDPFSQHVKLPSRDLGKDYVLRAQLIGYDYMQSGKLRSEISGSYLDSWRPAEVSKHCQWKVVRRLTVRVIGSAYFHTVAKASPWCFRAFYLCCTSSSSPL